MLMEGRPDLCIEHLGYSNSGDSPYGDTARVVGYHAFAAVGRRTSAGGPSAHGRFALTRAEKSALLAIARQSIADSLAGRRIRPVGGRCSAPAIMQMRGCLGGSPAFAVVAGGHLFLVTVCIALPVLSSMYMLSCFFVADITENPSTPAQNTVPVVGSTLRAREPDVLTT